MKGGRKEENLKSKEETEGNWEMLCVCMGDGPKVSIGVTGLRTQNSVRQSRVGATGRAKTVG